jgi:hypothetical protein
MNFVKHTANLRRQIINTLNNIENCTKQYDTETQQEIIDFILSSRDRDMYFLQCMYQIVHLKKFYIFCVKFNILNYFKTIIHNLWYTFNIATDYNTLSPSFQQELTSILPSECNDFIKANSIYSLLLKYYNIWTSYYIVSEIDDNEETVFRIENKIKNIFNKDVTSNCIFYRIKYILENYKPIYNPQVENYFISRDGQNVIHKHSYHYLNDELEKGLYSFTLNEILCFAYKNVYDDIDIIEDIFNFLYFLF